MTTLTLRESIREAALQAGFARVGFAPATLAAAAAATARTALRDWLAAGYAGELGSYVRDADGRTRAETLLAGARTVITVLLPYGAAPPFPAECARRGPSHGAGIGLVARYARGADYHVVVHRRLRAIVDALPRLAGRSVRWRIAVDTAPLFERAFAAAAGLGFVGKNNLLIAPGLGSYTVLGEVAVDLELPPDEIARPESARTVRSRCGRCRACLDACPTGALVAPHVLDARRCLAYLTISASGPLPRELRSALGARVFGCDACQEACPFNRSVDPVGDPDLAPPPAARGLQAPSLCGLLALRAKEHRRLTRGTALWRHPRAWLQRNAAVALGNAGNRDAVAPLGEALRLSRFSLVRGHAAWALGRLGGADARALLAAAHRVEPDAAVTAEIEMALEEG
jgi:epoxyqueuosine reductase